MTREAKSQAKAARGLGCQAKGPLASAFVQLVECEALARCSVEPHVFVFVLVRVPFFGGFKGKPQGKPTSFLCRDRPRGFKVNADHWAVQLALMEVYAPPQAPRAGGAMPEWSFCQLLLHKFGRMPRSPIIFCFLFWDEQPEGHTFSRQQLKDMPGPIISPEGQVGDQSASGEVRYGRLLALHPDLFPRSGGGS